MNETAIVLATGFVLSAIENAVVRYQALCVDAAVVAANAACWTSTLQHPGIRINRVKLMLNVEPGLRDEARRLAILRRTADIAGRDSIATEAANEIKAATEYCAPREQWIRVAKAIDKLARSWDDESRNDAVKSLATWATHFDRELAQALELASDTQLPSPKKPDTPR